MKRKTLRRIAGRKERNAPRGFVIDRGISPWNGEPYAVIATLESKNDKTGNMVQIWILREGMSPVEDRKEAQRLAGDGPNATKHTTCGDCPLVNGGCYVEWGQAPTAIVKCHSRGGYPEYDPAIHSRFFRNRLVRFGAGGEPVLIKIEIVEHIATISDGWTGYTQQWRNPAYQAYRGFFMASVHSIGQRDFAWSLGWRTFRTRDENADDEKEPGEGQCPASKEAGYRLTCSECMACDGTYMGESPLRASIVTNRHANAVQTKILNKAIREGRASFK